MSPPTPAGRLHVISTGPSSRQRGKENLGPFAFWPRFFFPLWRALKNRVNITAARRFSP